MQYDEVLSGAKSWDRDSLLRLAEELRTIAKKRAPFRLNDVWKRCGKPECTCNDDPDNRHGPYLVVSYKDINGTRRQVSLGPKYSTENLWHMAESKIPVRYDPAFIVPTGALRREPDDQDKIARGWEKITLTDDEFEHYYGLAVGKDKLGHHHQLWILEEAFNASVQQWRDKQTIAMSRWAMFGVGNIKAISLLDSLLDSGYYLGT